MKKKLLLAISIVVLLVCLFAISVSADAIKADSTSIDMKISFYDASGNEVSKIVKVDELFNVSYKNDASEYYFKLTGVKSWSVDIDGTLYSIKTQLAGLYFPEGITHMPDTGDGYWGFTAATADNGRKVHLPESLQCLGGNFLRNIGYVTLVNEDDTLDNYLPQSLTSVVDHAFCYWKLANPVLYFPEGFHNVGTSSEQQWNFEGFTSASGSITMVFLGEMTFIEFNGNEKSFKPTLIFAKNQASDMWGYELPMVEGSTTVANLASYVNNTTNAQTLRIYWHNKDGINASPNSSTQTATLNSDAPTIIFCGGDQVEYRKTIRFGVDEKHYTALKDENGLGLNANGISGYISNSWVRFYTAPMAYDMEAHNTADKHYNSRVIQAGNCGYDETSTDTCVICDKQSTAVLIPATGLHTYTDDFNCESALACEVCKKTLQEAKIHALITLIDYANGYASAGAKTVNCENEGCTVCNTNEVAPALFTNLGYSAAEYGDSQMSINYKVNKDAIAEYENITGVSISYGMFAVLADEIGNNDIFDASGKAYTGAVTADITNSGFNFFSLKMFGFTDEQKEIGLAMGAFVGTAVNGTTEYSYLQIAAPSEGSKYYFASYNDVLALLSDDKG